MAFADEVIAERELMQSLSYFEDNLLTLTHGVKFFNQCKAITLIFIMCSLLLLIDIHDIQLLLFEAG